MPETSLILSDITYGFRNRKPLFENLSCSLSNGAGIGKIIALMGPSGVGKTTFCDLALGVRHPQKGSIRFAPEKANVAVIPQKGIIFDELSVKENISCLKYSNTIGKTFNEKRIEDAVKSLDLTQALQDGTRASALSGGEAQRVMLARIQTIDCDVLILDEPCSFLDNRVKHSFLRALRETVDKSRLLALMVTHVWDEAWLVADEVLFFQKQTDGAVTLHMHPTAEVRHSPPTIDALYGIHWPDCVLHDLRADSPGALLAPDIPQNARFVGLFPDVRCQFALDRWASDLWHKTVTRHQNDVAGLHGSRHTINNGVPIAAAFYDDNQVLLRHSGTEYIDSYGAIGTPK